jgi:hypothetical protein
MNYRIIPSYQSSHCVGKSCVSVNLSFVPQRGENLGRCRAATRPDMCATQFPYLLYTGGVSLVLKPAGV